MNKELLFNLYCIHSESGNEKKMRKFLRKVANACGATSVETDKFGNLLIVKGESETYPCLAAHMDQVQRNHSKDFRVIEIEDDVIGWSPKCHEQQGLGADDKNGLFICLELLRKFDVMKVAFFVQEEVGGHGSDNVSLDFFKDCRFVIEPDRKGCSDLITSMSCGQVCSQDFIDAIGYQQFGYREDHGTFTDVANLVERGVGISCLNLSCGYYNAHSDEEITVLSHLQNCMDFVEHIVKTCTDVYPYEYVPYDFGYYGMNRGYRSLLGYGKGVKTNYTDSSKKNQSSWWDDEDEYYRCGYYEEDMGRMEEYLQTQPDLTFDRIKDFYKFDFNAHFFLDDDECESVLSDLYSEAKYGMTENWDDDSETVGELVLDMKKVS